MAKTETERFLGLTEDDMEPQKYLVELWDETAEGVAPVLTLTTWINWNIEGYFICTYDRDGLKSAYALPSEVSLITTKPVPPHKEEKGE